jgi:hypothetical protein
MKRVGFIGAYDKTNLIICLAKILATQNKKVLIVDTTVEQKFKYIVPTLNPTMTYITNWQEFDVAVGFKSMQQICQYLGITSLEEEYDFVLMNIDSYENANSMNVYENNNNFFVTAIDMYSIRKGLEIFNGLEKTLRISKIIFSNDMKEEETEYIERLSENQFLEWEEKVIFFPIMLEDRYAEMDGQMIYKVPLKSMSSLYKESVAILVSRITNNDITINEAKKHIKILEKEGI